MIKIIIKPDQITPPFVFNPLKHHLGFIRDVIKWAEIKENQPATFELINSIGPQVTDIYCGLLPVEVIINMIRSKLTKLAAFNQQAYEDWVWNSGKNYNFLELSDGSKWTFRKGEKRAKYIHFHPARTNGSIRVRGTTLKTAMGLKIIARENLSLYQDKDFINSVRQTYLELSPIKSLLNFPAINKILDILTEDNIDDTGFMDMI